MKICVIGTGYVGLVAGACLADFGNDVVCVDKVEEKIAMLRRGEVPIYEEGLEEVVRRNVAADRLLFTRDLAAAVADSEVVYLAVGTPPKQNGDSDLSALYAVATQVLAAIRQFTVIVVKSTAPVGTAQTIREMATIGKAPQADFDVISNPEFLRQGTAVHDFMNPERVIIGGQSERALRIMAELYQPFADRRIPIIVTTNETAEIIKYAANTFLAMKISFINEMANLCDRLDGDITQISAALGMDSRIGPAFLNPGPGFGGSCLPKDVKALIQTAKKQDYDFRLGKSIMSANEFQRRQVISNVKKVLGSYNNKRIAVLGLAFKANTDDTRESPAVYIDRKLHRNGSKVVAYDPCAMNPARRELPGVTLADSPYEACQEADILMILTEWPEFRKLDYGRMRNLMARPILYDTRNLLPPDVLEELGYLYFDSGRCSLAVARRRFAERKASERDLVLTPPQPARRRRRRLVPRPALAVPRP
jgi:UDPglucose 6-dehydrogenase